MIAYAIIGVVLGVIGALGLPYAYAIRRHDRRIAMKQEHERQIKIETRHERNERIKRENSW